ncbi:hypothetical protein EVJ58_g2549 [Rhodofomes roseus]|uniref:Cytochrome P450 n=1 Tax=Rhodofomes roseus TaxID=34475 RepID=A0A4Y9YS50_9APHY|nr:hypothetical protein EVJ58_g2549 [Rhodofomes roseus]
MADSATALVAALAPIQDGLLADAGLALLAHLWFKRYEPTDLVSLGILLGVLPAVPVALLRVPLASTPLAILVGYASFYAFLLFSITAYRLSPFHPLYKYPGPLLGRLTNFRGMFIAAGGKQHLYFKEMHAKYGPIVRLGPNVLSIVDTDLLPSILNMPRGPMWDGRRISGKRGQGTAGIQKGNLMGSRNMQVHGEARKVWNRAFTTASVKKYEPIVIRRVSQLVDELKGRCAANPSKAAEVDIAYWIDCFSFDFMGDFAFGGPFDLLRDGDKIGVLKMMEDSLFVPNLSGHVPWTIEAVVRLPFLPKGAKGLGEFAFKQVLRRLKEGAVHDDLFYHLNDEAKIDNDPPPLPVLVSNAVTAIVAGSDTTAASLTHALYLLMGHPTCYKRLQSELDAAFPPGGEMPTDSAKLAQLEYLNAVINETLRLFPALMTSLQRGPTPGSGGQLLGGKMFVPEGTGVYIPPYVYNRDPRFFSPNPEVFWPERWILAKSDPSITLNASAFLSFSAGPANCVGKPLALIEMRMTLASLLQAFEVRYADGYDSRKWVDGLGDFLVTTRGELPVVLKLR